jgi:4-amino-4-deoxy-L-arabinose transferase-like glycosyltransferase
MTAATDDKRAVAPAPSTAALRVSVATAAAILLIVALLAPVYCFRLDATDVIGDDEAREIGLIRDIALRGHWLLPRFNGATLPDKPLLYHWLAAGACRVAGRCDEAVVRLPSALAALALIGVVGFETARLHSPPAGVAAAALLGLMPALHERARSARPDVLLVLWLTVALFAFFAWWRRGGGSRRALAVVGTALGLAVLAKGPVAPIIAAVTVALFLVVRRDVGRVRALLDRSLIAPFIVLSCSWYAVALAAWGVDFARVHLLRRYLGNLVGGDLSLGFRPHHSPIYHLGFYPLHLLLMTLPWTPLLLAAVAAWWRRPAERRDPWAQFLQIWIITLGLGFGLATLKLRHYVLPALPAAVALMAPFAVNLLCGRDIASGTAPRRRPAWLLAVLAALPALACGGLVLLHDRLAVPSFVSRSDRDILAAIANLADADPTRTVLIGAAASLLTGAVAAAALARRWREAIGVVAVATVLWMGTLHPALEGAVSRGSSLKSFAEEIRAAVPLETPLYFYRAVLRPLVVYLDRPVRSLRGNLRHTASPRAFVIVVGPDLPRLEIAGAQLRFVATHHGRIGNLERGVVALVEVDRRPEG